MADGYTVLTQGKEERYQELIPQIKGLIDGEEDLIANLANIAAALKFSLNFFWVGFYFVKNEQLVLGPFQGPTACTRINKGKGVCGTAWLKGETLVIPNVDEFPGHITCNSASQSEIVLPVKKNGEVILVLDIDSDLINDFNSVDKKYLSQVVNILEKLV